ncbi:XdhC family protein [Pseudoroseicyclus sp. CXY001]|uniref:XdhC family protein n=1 Tax=Pseudoroseicyclus sp. CXY001 TaxID=3242492 RepID=UPI003571439F
MAEPTILQALLAWHRAGEGAVLATVTEAWSSAPTRPGAMLAICGSGESRGTLAGGAVEARVIPEALAALAEGAARELSLIVTDETARAARLACGGAIRVLLQPVGPALPEPLLAELAEAEAEGRSLALVTPLPPGPPPRLDGPAAWPERFRTGRSGEEEGVFVALYTPPLRLLVTGAGQIAEALVPMARLAGFTVEVIDPRPDIAASFSAAPVITAPPAEAIAAARPDPRTALVTLTHDHPVDDAALLAGLATPAFYIGSLGSRRTHAARLERLAAAGQPAEALERIHAPIGLNIEAVTPAEIAVSILAEIIATLRRR